MKKFHYDFARNLPEIDEKTNFVSFFFWGEGKKNEPKAQQPSHIE